MMQENRIVHTMTSNWSGVEASCMQVLSTIISLYVMVGNSFATARHSCKPHENVASQLHHRYLTPARIATTYAVSKSVAFQTEL